MSVIVATEQPFRNLGGQVGKLMDQLQKGYYSFAPGEMWTPNVNLYETESGYQVCVDLAGVDKEKIEITVEEQVLKLRGRRIVPMLDGAQNHTHAPDESVREPQTPRVRVHLMEIDHGSFSREVELPMDVRHELISAHHRNGLLWIELPKK